jgi:hypothetical protein
MRLGSIVGKAVVASPFGAEPVGDETSMVGFPIYAEDTIIRGWCRRNGVVWLMSTGGQVSSAAIVCFVEL